MDITQTRCEHNRVYYCVDCQLEGNVEFSKRMNEEVDKHMRKIELGETMDSLVTNYTPLEILEQLAVSFQHHSQVEFGKWYELDRTNTQARAKGLVMDLISQAVMRVLRDNKGLLEEN